MGAPKSFTELCQLRTEELHAEFQETKSPVYAQSIANIIIQRKRDWIKQRELAARRHKYEMTSTKRLTALLEAESINKIDRAIITSVLTERKKRVNKQ